MPDEDDDPTQYQNLGQNFNYQVLQQAQEMLSQKDTILEMLQQQLPQQPAGEEHAGEASGFVPFTFEGENILDPSAQANPDIQLLFNMMNQFVSQINQPLLREDSKEDSPSNP